MFTSSLYAGMPSAHVGDKPLKVNVPDMDLWLDIEMKEIRDGYRKRKKRRNERWMENVERRDEREDIKGIREDRGKRVGKLIGN